MQSSSLFSAKDGVNRIVEKMKSYGYTCKVKDEKDRYLLGCYVSSSKIYEKDKIDRIEITLPKTENLVNIVVISSEEPIDLSGLDDWMRKRFSNITTGPHIIRKKENFHEIEIGASNAWEKGASLVEAIIGLKRKVPIETIK